MALHVIFILKIFLLASCSGYRWQTQDNPFESYDIQSIAIPMFFNRSIYPEVGGHFAREITLEMSKFRGLKIISGNSTQADAVLVGIVASPERRDDSLAQTSDHLVGGADVGNRKEFLVPETVSGKMTLRLVLIKNATEEDLSALTNNSLHSYLVSKPKVIFDNNFDASFSYTNSVYSDNEKIDRGRVVNFTQSKANLEITLERRAKEVAESFRRTVLYAF